MTYTLKQFPFSSEYESEAEDAVLYSEHRTYDEARLAAIEGLLEWSDSTVEAALDLGPVPEDDGAALERYDEEVVSMTEHALDVARGYQEAIQFWLDHRQAPECGDGLRVATSADSQTIFRSEA